MQNDVAALSHRVEGGQNAKSRPKPPLRTNREYDIIPAEPTRLGTMFHPTILPTAGWLQHGLLYFDEIGLVAPDGLRSFKALVKARSESSNSAKKFAKQIAVLTDREILRPAWAEQLYNTPGVADKIIQRVEERLAANRPRKAVGETNLFTRETDKRA